MEPYQQLKREWADFNGLDPAGMVVCSSGTAALHLALEALHLPPGSRVIVPDFTFVSCARAVTMAGLEPVFVDCDERLCVSTSPLDIATEVHRTAYGSEFRHTRYELKAPAIMPVHVYGRRCDMDRIASWAARQQAYVIEDIAQAHGVRPHESTDAACWSFHRSKIVHGEEGGAVWFRDSKMAEHARVLRSVGQLGDYRHAPRGHNYRLANLLATPILQSLRCLDVDARRNAEHLWETECYDDWRMPRRDAPWVYDLRLRDCSMTRKKLLEVVQVLNEAGVPAKPSFVPLHCQSEYARREHDTEDWPRFPNAIRAGEEVLALPIRPGTDTRESCRRAIEIITSTLTKQERRSAISPKGGGSPG